MKRIICLMMAALLILSCSCKKAPQEEQNAGVVDIKAEESQQPETSEKEETSQQQSSANQPADNAEVADQSAEKTTETSENNKEESVDELYNYEVTQEPFETMKVYHSLANYKGYNSEQEMFDDSDLVIVGMPIETFTEGEEHYYTATGYEIEKGDSGLVSYCTVRNVKVLEVIKGDSTLETVKVANSAVIKDEEDGSKSIIGLPSGEVIAKKNVKYIYYIKKSPSGKYDYYYAAPHSGMINIDGLDTRFSNSGSRYEAAKNRVPELFEKYDRSAELVKE